MKSLQKIPRRNKILFMVAVFIVGYFPIAWLWGLVRPTYNEFLADTAGELISMLELSPKIRHRLHLVDNDFEGNCTVDVYRPGVGRSRISQPGTRVADLVSYNVTLWAIIFVASAAFIDRKALWRYLLFGAIVLVLAHIFDLIIFAKNTRSILLASVTKNHNLEVGYSYAWHRIWWWALEFNRRIMAPFLPLLLWIIICFRSFYRLSTSKAKK